MLILVNRDELIPLIMAHYNCDKTTARKIYTKHLKSSSLFKLIAEIGLEKIKYEKVKTENEVHIDE